MLFLQVNVPTCPDCNSIMIKRYQGEECFYVCLDCKAIWNIVGAGQSDSEIGISRYRREQDVNGEG